MEEFSLKESSQHLALPSSLGNSARQDSISLVFFWMPEEPAAKLSVWAQAPLTCPSLTSPELTSQSLEDYLLSHQLGMLSQSFSCEPETKKPWSCHWHI